MKVQSYNLTNENVKLTAYILGDSFDNREKGNIPSILVIPGGAYKYCSLREEEPIALRFLSMGYNAFVLEYSLNEDAKFPKPLEDAEEAMDIICNNADDWGVDVNKIAVCGFSAGGHLAACLGTMGRIRPAAMILGYPCISEDICNELDVLCNKNNLPVPTDYIDDKTPSAFIFACQDDTCVPVRSSLDFASKLNEKGIKFELHIYKKGGHGFSTSDYVTCDNIYEKETVDWFQKCKSFLFELFFK